MKSTTISLVIILSLLPLLAKASGGTTGCFGVATLTPRDGGLWYNNGEKFQIYGKIFTFFFLLVKIIIIIILIIDISVENTGYYPITSVYIPINYQISSDDAWNYNPTGELAVFNQIDVGSVSYV